jgi:hypothetical protein
MAVINNGLRVWVALKQNGEEPRRTDDGRDMANRRTMPERAGWDGELATRRYPRAGTHGEYREKLWLAESSIVSVGWSLPEPSLRS